MVYIGYFFLVGYMICLVYVTLFSLLQLHLLYKYLRKNKGEEVVPYPIQEYKLPKVTIQLPLFNEQYVVERLIDKIMEIDYPKDKLQVQIIDDSTDDTLTLSYQKAQQYKDQGYDIEVVRRADRMGFKAGALKDAMSAVKGEFIAIFDADFLPEKSFLLDVIPYFADAQVGVVQTRWGHINQDYSLLTEMQAFQLNVHFTIEQKGRERANYPLQFNGTAGVWRKTTIDDAGGWEADTLTEDLDLSYRAQMKGWKIKFLVDVVAPAELPAEIYGLKSQQYRWMKGGAETAKKLIPSILKSDLTLRQRLQSVFHLLASSVFIFVFLLGIFSLPVFFLLLNHTIDLTYFGLFLIGLGSLLAVYYVANVRVAWNKGSSLFKIIKFILIFPIFLALSMGLSFHNSIAVLQGYMGRKTAFVRTPKYGIKSFSDSWRKTIYKGGRLNGITIGEGVLSLVFLVACLLGIHYGNYNFFIFHLLLFVGYGTSFYYSIKHL